MNNTAKGKGQAKIEHFVFWRHLAGYGTYFVHDTRALNFG